MNRSELIQPQHLTRLAAIYIRQSSPQQVLNNQESLRLQYALQQRAQELGWPPDRIEVIDADLGLTAAAAQHREGFKELLAKVTLGQVGMILSVDVTRLSRNCSDWYPLLDLCGFKGCLIADRDGVYDPGTAKGRMLLGLKGQLSEIELFTIRARLTTGLLQKARRGDLAQQLPVGLVRDEQERVQKDPHLDVQQRIELVFALFLELKSASKVAQRMNQQELLLPRYTRFGDLLWRRPTIGAVLLLLRNPAYAGAFVHGRRQSVRKDLAHRPLARPLPREAWQVCARDKYPAYISWEQYEKIQAMRDDNRLEYTRERTRGVPREGSALLQGIVYGGESGHKMGVVYKQRTQYRCHELRSRYGVPVCQHILAEPVDRQVVAAFFEALSPAQLDLYDRVVRQRRNAQEQIERAQAQQVERLRYEAAWAERQFRKVDPDHRLVAGELERRWEHALRELQQAEEAGARQQQEVPPGPALDPQLRATLSNLGQQLPALWESGFLSRAQKKALLRCLIDKVVIHRQVRDQVHTRIVWRGGESTTFEVPIAVGTYQALSRAKEMEERIIALHQEGHSDLEIAQRLCTEGYRSPRHEQVLASTGRRGRRRHRIFMDRSQPDPHRPGGHGPIAHVAQQLAVTQNWIYARIYSGRIRVARDEATGMYLFPDGPDTLEQLRKLKTGEAKIVRL